MTYLKTFIVIGASAAALALAPSAHAQQDQDVIVSGNSVIVMFGDLNLNSERGIEIFDHRIRGAVETVCGGQPESNVLFGGPVRQCQRETMARVQPARASVLAAARNANGQRLAATQLEIRRNES